MASGGGDFARKGLETFGLREAGQLPIKQKLTEDNRADCYASR